MPEFHSLELLIYHLQGGFLTNQRLSVRELYFFGALLLIPVLFIGGRVVWDNMSHKNINELILERNKDELAKRLKNAKPDDVIFENQRFGSSKSMMTNSLGIVATRCDRELVNLFLDLAGEKMSAKYLSNAILLHSIGTSATQCPDIGITLEKFNRKKYEKR